VTSQFNQEIDTKGLEIQITELLRLELEIHEDISKQQRDLERVKEQRELLQTQVKLIREKQLGQETE
jgi:hypothetical protein